MQVKPIEQPQRGLDEVYLAAREVRRQIMGSERRRTQPVVRVLPSRKGMVILKRFRCPECGSTRYRWRSDIGYQECSFCHGKGRVIRPEGAVHWTQQGRRPVCTERY